MNGHTRGAIPLVFGVLASVREGYLILLDWHGMLKLIAMALFATTFLYVKNSKI